MEYRLSHRAQNLRRCMMDAFHLRDAKDMIFFNSGQPAADLYPRDLLCAVIDELLADDPQILAYPGSQGDEELREALAERQNRLDVGAGIRSEQIVVTNGGTGGADLLAQLFTHFTPFGADGQKFVFKQVGKQNPVFVFQAIAHF